jgi:hypothetical protein
MNLLSQEFVNRIIDCFKIKKVDANEIIVQKKIKYS